MFIRSVFRGSLVIQKQNILQRRMGRFFDNGASKAVIECRNVQKSVEYCGIPLETHEHPEPGVVYCIWCRQFFELLEFRESHGNAG